ncbi:MAG: AAA family ATPase [Candidatus Thiothrix singaporensis]|uniref:AAA family ATPase n=1 Tax=Candidatus Thiothrix singaporensis TaxID=2799669 RepID=A0A7L6AW13_9GAMM|nr:MAG: AAA family ATPase [Candidatus Thiothrix singaporensis]
MWLSKVAVSNCRIVACAELELAAHANVLHGDNASGKSSLLEALAVLSRGRSFRTPRISELITRGTNELTVSARIEDGIAGGGYPAGICKSNQATRIRINHADAAPQAELSAHIPLTLIHPASVDLVTGGLPYGGHSWIGLRFTALRISTQLGATISASLNKGTLACVMPSNATPCPNGQNN